MSEEILVNVTSIETRVAIVEGGLVQEIYIERASERTRVGSIIKGKVLRVLPGMQAAFVDIGWEKAAFIHVADLFFAGKTHGPAGETLAVPIQSILHEGQAVVVQVVKDQIGEKGSRLTMHLSIPSRFLVFMPYTNHVGISQRIEAQEERERLKTIIEDLLKSRNFLSAETGLFTCGVIARTVAENISKEALEADLDFLIRLWGLLQKKVTQVDAVHGLHVDLPLYLRVTRDLLRTHVEKLRIDHIDAFKSILAFISEFMPGLEEKIEYYAGTRQIFELYSAEDEIQKSLQREVSLKSGGYLIFDQTEALTTIDINTGAFVGSRNLEETIFKTNLEATHAIARQLRLRNLGGIIIIDFIDMQDEEHQRQVIRTLEKQLEKDHARCKVMGVSGLGLVEMTRKRTRESLERILCEPCKVCAGRGRIKTAVTVCYEIFREIRREARTYHSKSYLIIAAQSVIDRLLDEESSHVADLEEEIKATLQFQVESIYSQELFDIVLAY